MAEETYYATVGLAELAIIQEGFKRDPGRAVWVNAAGKTATVMWTGRPGKFYVKRG